MKFYLIFLIVIVFVGLLGVENSNVFAEESTEISKMLSHSQFQKNYPVLYFNHQYNIEYAITNGNAITDISHGVDGHSIIIKVNATSDGILLASIPHTFFNFVFIGGCYEPEWFISLDEVELQQFEQLTNYSHRIVLIPLSKNSSEIEIIARIVPENHMPFEDCLAKAQQEIKPVQQYEIGIGLEKIICREGLETVFKTSDYSPACVKPKTVEKLVEQGWVRKSTDIYTKYTTKEVLEKFQSSIIPKEKAIELARSYLKQNNIVLNVNMTDPHVHITTDLVYSILSEGHLTALEVNPETGLPTSIVLHSTGTTTLQDVNPETGLHYSFTPWWDKHYKNPQWWAELQKDHLGMKSNRVENGEFVWRVGWRGDPFGISEYPEFFINAISGEIIRAPSNEFFK